MIFPLSERDMPSRLKSADKKMTWLEDKYPNQGTVKGSADISSTCSFLSFGRQNWTWNDTEHFKQNDFLTFSNNCSTNSLYTLNQKWTSQKHHKKYKLDTIPTPKIFTNRPTPSQWATNIAGTLQFLQISRARVYVKKGVDLPRRIQNLWTIVSGGITNIINIMVDVLW